MSLREIYNSLSATIIADRSPATEHALAELMRIHSKLEEILPALENGLFCRSPKTCADDSENIYLDVLGEKITKSQVIELKKIVA